MVAERVRVAVAERPTATAAAREIVWLGEPAAEDRSLVGGKVAPLSRLAEQYRVPPGFCLTTRAFEQASNSASSRGGQDAAEDLILPDALRQQIVAAYQQLGALTGLDQPAVAVRSSAVDEDSADTSFAGQHDTYLNVVGPEAICEAVLRCWASAQAPRVLEYRRQHGLPTDGARIAVLVQQLVVADVSGIVFSANPLTGTRHEVVVNASWGLGESVVGGSVTPDTYVVSASPDRSGAWNVLQRGLAEKCRMTVAVVGGTREVDVPRLLRSRPALCDEQIAEMASLARDLEQAMGWPVDLEVAFRDDRLYLLQCRPITTLRTAARLEA
ncbi:MAG TPA: PEP/pyruvate-binding domain-containing protein [Chloroflexota bacterium]|nr:PEP/pyruvate-binding domain-containing protein [Chloroflexota bacterium]